MARPEAPRAGAAKTFVLVHGAWHGGWCWRDVAAALRAEGHRVFTPTQTGLGERRQSKSGHRADLRLLVLETVGDAVDQVTQMRKDGTAHHNRNLLHDTDTGVTGLPGLLRATDGFQEG